VDIAIGYVPPVFSQMEHDSICPAQLTQRSRVDRVWERLLARIAKGRYVINIDEKARSRHRIPGNNGESEVS
jgi:hypothetical protein